jgi:hypothetical protein
MKCFKFIPASLVVVCAALLFSGAAVAAEETNGFFTDPSVLFFDSVAAEAFTLESDIVSSPYLGD